MTPAALLEASQHDTFWVPADAEVLDRPELLMIGCARPLPYLNVVLRARGDLAALRAEAEARQGSRPLRWMLTDTVDPAPAARMLAAAGWVPGETHEVRTLPIAAWSRRAPVPVHPVDSRARLLDCIAVADAAFGGWGSVDEANLQADLRACGPGGRVHRFVAYVDGQPAASGGLTAFPDLGFGLLWAGAAVPALRGRGAYTAVLAARIERARALGLARVGLYALGSTSAPIVARKGFELGGEMRFWTRPRAG